MVKSPEEYRNGLTGVHPDYDDGRTLKSYQTSEKQFPNPSDMVKFMGFGVNEESYDRGFCAPNLSNDPQYDSGNYKRRWSEPMVSDMVEGGQEMPSDWEFQQKEKVSKGFLSRPHIPVER